jgi:hypothetical protein
VLGAKLYVSAPGKCRVFLNGKVMVAGAVPPKKPSSPAARPGAVKTAPGKPAPMALDTSGSKEIGYRIAKPLPFVPIAAP